MMYTELANCLPTHFEMLLMASQRVLSEGVGSGIMSVAMPLKVQDLLNTLEMMVGRVDNIMKMVKQLINGGK